MSYQMCERVKAHSKSTGRARAVLLELAAKDFGKGLQIDRESMARRTGLGVRTISRALVDLAELGDVLWERTGRSSVYYVLVLCPQGCEVQGHRFERSEDVADLRCAKVAHQMGQIGTSDGSDWHIADRVSAGQSRKSGGPSTSSSSSLSEKKSRNSQKPSLSGSGSSGQTTEAVDKPEVSDGTETNVYVPYSSEHFDEVMGRLVRAQAEWAQEWIGYLVRSDSFYRGEVLEECLADPQVQQLLATPEPDFVDEFLYPAMAVG